MTKIPIPIQLVEQFSPIFWKRLYLEKALQTLQMEAQIAKEHFDKEAQRMGEDFQEVVEAQRLTIIDILTEHGLQDPATYMRCIPIQEGGNLFLEIPD